MDRQLDEQTLVVMALAGEAIYASIQTHKRAEAAHKRQARRLWNALEALRSECERQGVVLEITETPQGGSHSERRAPRSVTDRRT